MVGESDITKFNASYISISWCYHLLSGRLRQQRIDLSMRPRGFSPALPALLQSGEMGSPQRALVFTDPASGARFLIHKRLAATHADRSSGTHAEAYAASIAQILIDLRGHRFFHDRFPRGEEGIGRILKNKSPSTGHTYASARDRHSSPPSP
jgi:hypothetical protein